MFDAPRLVYWETTKRCNLRCAHCRAVPQDAPSPEELSREEGFRLLEAIAETGPYLLVMTGGEPLLRQELFEWADYGSLRDLKIALATNGTLVTRPVAQRIVDAGFKRVSISLDGPDAGTHDRFRRVPGAFDKAVDGFIHLKELGMSMQVNSTVTQHNRHRLEELYELVRKLGADAWHIFLLVPVGCGLEIADAVQLTPRDYEEVLFWIDEVAVRETKRRLEVRATCAPHVQRIRLQRQAMAAGKALSGKREATASEAQETLHESRVTNQTRRGCLAGIGICFISHAGDVYPCGYLPLPAGNVRHQPLAAIWDQAPVFADLRDPNRLRGKCLVCEYRIVCGGCRARVFGQTGDYLGEEPFCAYLPEQILRQHRRLPC
jgi:radical SAM protein with 4Fe4S-binding SPASM domain